VYGWAEAIRIVGFRHERWRRPSEQVVGRRKGVQRCALGGGTAGASEDEVVDDGWGTQSGFVRDIHRRRRGGVACDGVRADDRPGIGQSGPVADTQERRACGVNSPIAAQAVVNILIHRIDHGRGKAPPKVFTRSHMRIDRWQAVTSAILGEQLAACQNVQVCRVDQVDGAHFRSKRDNVLRGASEERRRAGDVCVHIVGKSAEGARAGIQGEKAAAIEGVGKWCVWDCIASADEDAVEAGMESAGGPDRGAFAGRVGQNGEADKTWWDGPTDSRGRNHVGGVINAVLKLIGAEEPEDFPGLASRQ
jgi:hypothetical protein